MSCYEVFNVSQEQLHTRNQYDMRINTRSRAIDSPYSTKREGEKISEMSKLRSQVEEYSKRKFTYASDELNGFLGILASLEPQGMLHWYGLPILPVQQELAQLQSGSMYRKTDVLSLHWTQRTQRDARFEKESSTRIRQLPSCKYV